MTVAIKIASLDQLDVSFNIVKTDGKCKWVTDFRVMFGDMFVASGRIVGRCTRENILAEVRKGSHGGVITSRQGLEMAKAAKLL